MTASDRPRRVVVLGSTGSIGTQTVEVVRAHPQRFRIVGLAAGRDADAVAAQAAHLGVSDLALADPEGASRLARLLPEARVRAGLPGVVELAALPDVDVVVNGIVGSQGLRPTLSALDADHVVALANKESLIVGGPLVVAAARRHVGSGGDLTDMLVPVDSEHSALAQCLRGARRGEVARLVLTASGGPFRGRGRDALAAVTPADALAHPTWDMGPVVTVNSATLMNKGLELIEAHLLFDVGFDALDVVVHPQSVVHSMVEFVDGSVLAQLSPPDMRLPIQLALGWPDRFPHRFAGLDLTTASRLDFEPVDRETFRALSLAEEAGARGSTYPAVLNAANEEAVAAFLAGRIGFLDIPAVVEDVMAEHTAGISPTLEDVVEAEAWARRTADGRLDAGGGGRGRTTVISRADGRAAGERDA